MTHRILVFAGLAALLVAAGLIMSGSILQQRHVAAAAQEQKFSFGLIGDLGYFAEHEPWVDNVFADLNKDASLAFVVHVGDLSRPVLGCTDDMQARRLSQFNASIHPLIYTPGDNEWTDCHDAQGTKGGNPLERLTRLRTLFFADEHVGTPNHHWLQAFADPALPSVFAFSSRIVAANLPKR